MTTEPQCTISTIPALASDTQINLYKHIRLSGLRLDPGAFGSTFERESTFTDDVWRSRINTRGRTTLLASIGDGDDMQAAGTLSILGPEMLAAIPPDPEYPASISEQEREGLIEVHILVGMWVHLDYRRRGVGRALIQRALELVKDSSSKLDSEIRKEYNPGKTTLLLVHNDQQTARSLYKAAGFKEDGEVEHAGKASTWMSYTSVAVNEKFLEKLE